MKVGFTCSSFDLLHAGHILMLKDCKNHCDHLVVGLQTDPTIDRKDKNKPIQSLFERFIQLQAVSHIDEICIYETEEQLKQLIEYIRPDIRFIGVDWYGKEFTDCNSAKLKKYEMHYNPRYGYSTSKLRKDIYKAEKKRRNA